MAVLPNLPFPLQTNVIDQAYSGRLTLSFEFDIFTDAESRPLFFAATIWSRATNAQFFTSGGGLTRVELLAINQQNASLILTLRCENVEPAAWLSLLCQLAQVSPGLKSLRLVKLDLESPPSSGGADWIATAKQALFSLTNMPRPFEEAQKSLVRGQPIYVEVEFARNLAVEECSSIAKELELWGCLLATGGLRLDFTPVEEPLHAMSFGRMTQLSPSWIRYVKQEFDGPVEALALLDHWLRGLSHRGIPVASADVS